MGLWGRQILEVWTLGTEVVQQFRLLGFSVQTSAFRLMEDVVVQVAQLY